MRPFERDEVQMRSRRFCMRVLTLALLFSVAFLGQESAAEPVRREQMNEVQLLARIIAAEARGEPLAGQVAVGSVILNRVQDPAFPNTLSGVIFQPSAFESVSNGLFYQRSPTRQEIRAALTALNGWDPTYGAIYFWEPAKSTSRWIWSRQVVRRIGGHLFAR